MLRIPARLRSRHAISLIPCLATGVLLFGACSSEDGVPGGVGDLSETGVPDSMPDIKRVSDEGGEDGGDAGCPLRCSTDLHEVLDCHGAVVTKCSDDKGCESKTGTCIAACDSARAEGSGLGCEFYTMPPVGNAVDSSTPVYAAVVANYWTTPVSVHIEFKGQSYDASKYAYLPSGSGPTVAHKLVPDGMLQPGQAALFFLGEVDLPSNPPDVTPMGFDFGIANGSGIAAVPRIVTSAPAVAYNVYPYNTPYSYAYDFVSNTASLLLATSSWGTNYVIPDQDGETYWHGAQIVAAEDGTSVTVVPTVGIGADGGAGASFPKNTATTVTLQRGEMLQLYTNGLLAGSIVQSTKPVGMWTGAPCFNVDGDFCDSAQQQIPSVNALGSEYVAVKHQNRLETGATEAPPWRILGLVDGTKLTYDPGPPEGAPIEISAGQMLTFHTSQAFVVRSQDDEHPIYVAAYMTGCRNVGNPGGLLGGCMGDAEYVNVVPPQQFLSKYTFLADPNFPATSLVVVRAKGEDGTFKDVTLDCAGALAGWQSVGAYEYTRVTLAHGNFEPQGACDNGVHDIHSDAPFGVTVWGWGSSDTLDVYTEETSYAYPAGQSMVPRNGVVIPAVPK